MFQLIKWPAWKIFLLALSGPVLTQVFATPSVNVDTTTLNVEPWQAMGVLTVIWVQLFWTRQAGLYLHARLEAEGRGSPSVKVFRWTVSFSLIYQTLFAIMIFPESFSHPVGEQEQNIYLLIVEIIARFTAIYSLYFVAYCLCAVESKRREQVGSLILVTVLLMFFPIGIWFVQPRVLKQLNQQSSDEFYMEM